MFAKDTFKRLTRPKRERAQSAPPATILRDSLCGGGIVAEGFLFKSKRAQLKPQQQYASARTIHKEEEEEEEEPDNATVSTASVSRSLPSTSSRRTDRVNALVNALKNQHLCDVTLVGKEGVRVRASKYVLTCRCEYFENKFSAHAYHQVVEEEEEQLYIGEYSQHVIQAMVDYCFTGELTDFTSKHALRPVLESVENIVQLARIAVDLNFLPLQIEAYQQSRRFMNQHLYTACLFYAQDKTCPTDLLKYAQLTLQECPEQALFGTKQFVSFLSAKRIETLLQALLHDLEELEKVQLLQLWFNNGENDLQVARRLASTYIDLQSPRIRRTKETVLLLQESNLFDQQDIIPHVDSILASSLDEPIVEEEEEQCSEEHVVVTGAGRKAVNGIYLVDEEEEDMYVTANGDYTLYCWKKTWHIAATYDLSNSLYQCASSNEEKVPSCGWTSVGADRPVPTCVWKAAAKDNGERIEGEREET